MHFPIVQWGPIKAPWFSFWMLMNTFTVGLWNFQQYYDMTTQTSTPNYSHWFDCWLFRIQNNQIQMKYFHLGKPSIKKGLEIFQTSPPLKVWSLSAAFLTIFCRCAVQFVQYSIACLSECKSPKQHKINQSTLSPSSSPPATSPSTLPPPLSPSSSPPQFLPSS